MLRDLIALPNSSRVWVFQGNQELSYDEIDLVRPMIYDYVDQWSSHGTAIDAYGNVFHKRFLVFVADESKMGVSGCAIDTNNHFVQLIGNKLNVDFLDRMNYALMDDQEEIKTIHHIEFKSSFEQGLFKENTLIFDNLVSSKEQFLTQWIKPIKDSWHYKFIA